jgi:hypothetical protein
MLNALNLDHIDPILYETLLMLRDQTASPNTRGSISKWKAEGPGPVALIGNTWAAGVTLAPRDLIRGASRVVAIDYHWDSEKLRMWKDHCVVRLVLTDARDLKSWSIEFTAERGSVIVPAEISMSGNMACTFQLKAGDRTGNLHSPPYIKTAGIQLRYRS